MKNSKYEFLTFYFSIGENSLIIRMRSLACLLINFKSQIYIVLTVFIQLFLSDKVCSLAWMKDSLVVEDLHFRVLLEQSLFSGAFWCLCITISTVLARDFCPTTASIIKAFKSFFLMGIFYFPLLPVFENYWKGRWNAILL